MSRGGHGGNGDRGGGGHRGRGIPGSDVGGARSRSYSDGLNPNRQKGFNWQPRIETPTLNDMKAKQGAVVSKFMNFMNRKSTVMIELYEKAFYNRKPGWDNMANFVYNDLCTTDVLRQGVEDVQFHPVKMIIFIKFKSDEIRDQVVEKLQSVGGVFWTEYGVSVRGHSLDANVRLIRVLGVSPETTGDDIRSTFSQTGVGEVVDLRKGLLDPRRMPGVTNGTWVVRVRISDADKNIPPYIIRREEGELWSLNFEGRRFVCWKCGSPDHIGDKCKDQERTFEEVFGDDKEVSPHSWAAVVKGNSGLDEDIRARRDAMAKQIKDRNDTKAKEKKEAEDKRKTDLEELEMRKKCEELERQEAIVCGRTSAKKLVEKDDVLGDSLDDAFIGEDVAEANARLQLSPLPQRGAQRNRVGVDGLGTSQGGDDDDPGEGQGVAAKGSMGVRKCQMG